MINGFGASGIQITGAGATADALYGNYIGITAVGSAALANNLGIEIVSGAASNIIGGTSAGSGNVVSGNVGHGVIVTSSNTVQGNKMGTDPTGTAKIANGGYGLFLVGDANNAGGTVAGAGNIASGNALAGIAVSGVGNLIYGNTIGGGVTETETTLGNGAVFGGIYQFSGSGTEIGGLSGGQGNLIAYNSTHGLNLVGAITGIEVKGNTIRNNSGNGILSSGPGFLVVENLIRDNGGASNDGVVLAAGGTGAKVYQNTIDRSGGDGVSVEATGAVIRNNIFTGNGGDGMNRVAATTTESYNDVTDAATAPANALGRSNVALDPTDLNANMWPEEITP